MLGIPLEDGRRLYELVEILNSGYVVGDSAIERGTHFCLGANLARVETSAIIPEVLSRLNDLELAGPVERTRSNLINGIHSMPVRFTPARRLAAR